MGRRDLPQVPPTRRRQDTKAYAILMGRRLPLPQGEGDGMHCPTCRGPAVASVNTITVYARLDANFHHTGVTDPEWDSQEYMTGDDGQPVLQCQQGHDWEAPRGWNPSP